MWQNDNYFQTEIGDLARVPEEGDNPALPSTFANVVIMLVGLQLVRTDITYKNCHD
jgi:hypothetical protein